jgi:hypothetical protein
VIGHPFSVREEIGTSVEISVATTDEATVKSVLGATVAVTTVATDVAIGAERGAVPARKDD